jgi:large exoprotein involved in heme utilization and adhesion
VGESAAGFPSIISSRARADATGPGGRIAITSPIVEVHNGAQISSGTEGAGAAGAIEIYASDRITIVGGTNGVSAIEAASFVTLGGPSGTIRIEAGRLDLQDGGQITASTSGSHDAGSIEIEAARVAISGAADTSGANQSGVFSKSLTFGINDGGNGGDIVITGFKSVAVFDGGQISADTRGSGLGGSIEIRDGGSIRMDRGSISANASSSGNAGNIVIDARGVFRMNDSAVTTKATESSGGNIEITARDQVYLGSSQIETEVLAGAPGEAAGDVTVRSQIAALNRSHIIANAVGLDVDAGNISITVDQFILSGDSFLRATAETGISGTIEVSSPDSDLTGTLATLPDSFFDASQMMARNCAARTTRAGSFAVDTGGALPPPPGETLELDGAATGIAPTDEAEECRAVEDLS